MSLTASFCVVVFFFFFFLFFLPRDVLDEIWDLIESVSEGFPTYSSLLYPSCVCVGGGGMCVCGCVCVCVCVSVRVGVGVIALFMCYLNICLKYPLFILRHNRLRDTCK